MPGPGLAGLAPKAFRSQGAIGVHRQRHRGDPHDHRVRARASQRARTSTTKHIVRDMLRARTARCRRRIAFHHIPTNECWTRDHGPAFVLRTSRGRTEAAIVDWGYNAWGGKYPPYDADDAVPTRVADGAGAAGVPSRHHHGRRRRGFQRRGYGADDDVVPVEQEPQSPVIDSVRLNGISRATTVSNMSCGSATGSTAMTPTDTSTISRASSTNERL